MDLQDARLVGIWEATYDAEVTGVDTLVLKADGTFQQTFDGPGYTYQTRWNTWSIERLPGAIHVHLEGARFFDEGIAVAEQDGIGCPASQPGCGSTDALYPFWDPLTKDPLNMVNELVLTVRAAADSPGGLILKQMRLGADDLDSSEFRLIRQP